MSKNESRILFLVKKEIERSRIKNPRFSLRAFARRSQLYPSHLSELLSGKRPLSPKAAKKLISALTLPSGQSNALIFDLGHDPAESLGNRRFHELSMDEIHILSDQFYFSVLVLAETTDFEADPKWIARRLKIQIREAKQALIRLERTGLLIKDQSSKLIPSGKSITTTHDLPSEAIRKGHYQTLDLARSALDETPVDERDFTSITVATSNKKLREAKAKIRAFRRSLMQFLDEVPVEDKTEVFQMNFQLFPITHKTKKEASL